LDTVFTDTPARAATSRRLVGMVHVLLSQELT
jgi:hypothetical protein